MKIQKAEFQISNSDWKKCPIFSKPEYAFIGRSNVGKSSLINMITSSKDLAKTSSTPGKTKLINHFLINDNWYIVDLPGYGYAKASKETIKNFGELIEGYLLHRENLINTFVLIDSRLPLQKIDLDFMSWLAQNNFPFSVVFTKTDKLSKTLLSKNIENYKKELSQYWETLPPIFLTSSEKKQGREELLDYIEQINNNLASL